MTACCINPDGTCSSMSPASPDDLISAMKFEGRSELGPRPLRLRTAANSAAVAFGEHHGRPPFVEAFHLTRVAADSTSECMRSSSTGCHVSSAALAFRMAPSWDKKIHSVQRWLINLTAFGELISQIRAAWRPYKFL